MFPLLPLLRLLLRRAFHPYCRSVAPQATCKPGSNGGGAVCFVAAAVVCVRRPLKPMLTATVTVIPPRLVSMCSHLCVLALVVCALGLAVAKNRATYKFGFNPDLPSSL